MLKSVYLQFSRPQYISVPEAFITALGSRAFSVDYDIELDDGQAAAAAYESHAGAARRGTAALAFHQTKPEGEKLAGFASALESAGLDAEDQRALASAVASAVSGVRAKDGKVRAAIPMSPSLALTQNLRGLAATRNPPDLGGILETFFQMGAPAGSDGAATASQWWLRASDRRLSGDKVVRAIDSAVGNSVFAGVPRARADDPLSGTSNEFAGTPFSWFHRTWTLLCSDQWVDALPARVWVDWANTVLRLAFGMGYLWEVAWYEAVARSVVGQGDETREELARSLGALLPWKDAAAGVSVRDVASSTKWRVLRSNGLREHIRDWVESHTMIESADAQLTAMRKDPSLRASLTEALSGPSGTNENLWEAINYALLTREGVGTDADHYGFLRKQGRRYSVPDPGVEWMAATSSLSCPGPGTTSNVGKLLRDLRELGLRPELGDLVLRLEQAGIARGSADADQAVAIAAAF